MAAPFSPEETGPGAGRQYRRAGHGPGPSSDTKIFRLSRGDVSARRPRPRGRPTPGPAGGPTWAYAGPPPFGGRTGATAGGTPYGTARSPGRRRGTSPAARPRKYPPPARADRPRAFSGPPDRGPE